MPNKRIPFDDRLEFDSQARYDFNCRDNGFVPANSRSLSLHADYRCLAAAYGEEGLENFETDVRSPLGNVVTDSRRRAIELFYEEVNEHNSATKWLDDEEYPNNTEPCGSDYSDNGNFPEEWRKENDKIAKKPEEEDGDIAEELQAIQDVKDEKNAKRRFRKKTLEARSWTFLTGDQQRAKIERSKERYTEAIVRRKKAA